VATLFVVVNDAGQVEDVQLIQDPSLIKQVYENYKARSFVAVPLLEPVIGYVPPLLYEFDEVRRDIRESSNLTDQQKAEFNALVDKVLPGDSITFERAPVIGKAVTDDPGKPRSIVAYFIDP